MTEYLFSYGTLQLEKVQIESFGRILRGTNDSLKNYRIASLEITDEKVLQQSGQQFHPIALPSLNADDKIDGVVFEITSEELLQADKYEVADYKRIAVTLESGKRAWMYVSATAADL
ncbi:MAG: gamma-glutamylcyclotransferase family protein [Chitinophagaceae bacterium]